MIAASIAFDPPGLGGRVCPSRERPIDLVHLGRQTMGDKALEDEVLGLFARQARQCVEAFCDEADGNDAKSGKSEIAHRLKGAARGVGAFRIAAIAESLETSPNDEAGRSALIDAVAEAENFICGLSR